MEPYSAIFGLGFDGQICKIGLMSAAVTPSGRVSGRRLALLLGSWRHRGARHAFADLAAAIRKLVLDGLLPAGTRLPAERELADALGVSRTLVTAAMDVLRTDGLVASRRGAGSWITIPGRTHAPPEPPPGPELIDLARAAPPALPGLAGAVDAARLALAGQLAEPGYHAQGLPALRARIADWFTARGLPTAPGQILVTSGAHHAFVLVLRMLANPGDRVLVELPTYPNALDAIRTAHATPVPVAMTDEGWDLDGIEAALRQAAPRLAYLIVDFQNPSGFRLDAEGRRRLAAALRRARTPAVVDETLVELDLDGDPVHGPPPMAAFAEDTVITVGSASKSHWGGLRLGWVRAPAELLHRLVAVRAGMDLGSPVIEQLVLAEMLADPEPALTQRRAETAAQRDVLLDALAEHCPGWTVRRPGGGLSAWCRLDTPTSTRLAVAAENVGLRLAPGSRFGAHGGMERWLRLPYTLPVDTLREAVGRLARAAAAVAGSGTAGADETAVPVV
jgi:DNA-binding transcriptional MocR family regulator